MALQITQVHISSARRVYWWLLVAPIVTVPVWLFGLIFSSISGSSPGPMQAFGMAIGATVFSWVFYAPVFFWVFSPDLFLQAHARQGITLLMLRAASALFFAYFLLLDGHSSPPDWVYFLPMFNAVLWFLGFLIGWDQTAHGRAWLGDFQVEIIPPVASPAPVMPPSRQGSINRYMHTFRTGTPAERQSAIASLESLGQVETF